MDHIPFDDRDFLQDDLSNALALGDVHFNGAVRILGTDAAFAVVGRIDRAGRIGYAQLRFQRQS